MHLLQTLRPDWRDLLIHESSPGNTASDKLWRLCAQFKPSQYDLSTPFGQINHATGCQSEDLQSQTFANEVFDVVVTQDVFEHIFDPGAAIREIARTLKPGGFHICTVPLVRQALPSRRRAVLRGSHVEHLAPAEYHVNPIDEKGSLVTIDWGWDIAEFFQFHSGLSTTIYMLDRLDMGIRADLCEVLVARKACDIDPLSL
jgi:SAM-dependent methyltransferase